MLGWLFGRKREATADVGGNAEMIVVSRRLNVAPERAFAVFVDEIGRWWPRDATWAGERLAEIGIEARLNGSCFEIDRDSVRAIWGTVLSFQRPAQIVIAWQIRPDRTPEENPSAASRVDVRFSAVEGGTEVVIVHRDFPRHGDGWENYRKGMASAKGWPRLIDLYAAAVQA